LKHFPEFFSGQLAIPEDLVKQAGTDDLARVHRYNRASAILVTQEVMTAFDPENSEAALSEAGNKVGAGDPRTSAHAAMVTR
jgi:hypothetical protein